MAFTDTKLSYFHSFSKMPAQNSTSLGNAINKSGHTVTASEVWAQDIPYYGKMGSIEDVKSKVQPYARKNDMCYITAGADKGKTFQYDGNDTWTDITATLVDGALIKNSKDEVVLLYHKGQNLTNLTADNNANTDSANNAARLWASRAKDGTSLPVGETRLIEQFVAPTDKALNGLASVAYAPVIANGSLVSGTGYYDYCFSGTILWATARTAVTPIDCFEYVGGKVSDVADTVASHASTIAIHTSEISELKDKLGIEDDDNPDSGSTPTLGGRVTALETAVETLNGDATTDGSIAKSIKEAIDGLGDVAVKSDIDNAISDATLADSEKIATATDTSKLVTVEDVTTYVSENAKVTLTQGTGITVTPNGEASTEFTIAVDDTVATKQSVDDLSATVSGVSQTVTDIQTSLSTGSIATAIQAAQDAADAAQDTADEAKGIAETAVQSVKVNGTALTKTGTEVDITAIVGVDETATNGIKVTKTDDNKVKVNVTPATYTSSTKQWENGSYFATASDIATAISDAVNDITIPVVTTSTAAQAVGVTASGHEVSVATADYTPASETGEIGTWTDASKGYLVTGATVAAAIGDVNAKVDALHQTPQFKVVVVDGVTDLSKWQDSVTGGIQENYIYLVENIDAADGSYIEYIAYKNGETLVTERIGTTKTDLTGYAKSVTINGATYTASAANAGALDLGTVVNSIGYSNDTSKGNSPDNSGSIQASIVGGSLYLGIASATSDKMGVSKMFTDELSSTSSDTDATDTAVSVKSAQAMYSSLATQISGKADANNVVNSINGIEGAVNLCVHNGVSEYIGPHEGEGESFDLETKNHANLWGTQVFASGGSSEQIVIIDSFVGLPWGTNTSSYLELAALPSDAVTVENNFVMNAEGRVITTIRPERMYKDFSAQNARTSLKSFVGDLPNLTTAVYGDGEAKRTFYTCNALELFIGDLSSLTDGNNMFCGCLKLKSFAGDLSSLTNGQGMFFGCAELTSFTSDLSSLTDGSSMFGNCNLDAESLECIAETLPTVTGSPSIDLGTLGGANPAHLKAAHTIQTKGWVVYSNGTQFGFGAD